MALNDIYILNDSTFGNPGSAKFAVFAGTTVINAGEPVGKALGSNGVAALATNTPAVGTDFMAGIAATTSTNTSSANGTVQVTKLIRGLVYLIAPKAPTSWDTQAEYDALVGKRVLFDLTAGTYTILASDSSGNGLVVEPLDITRYPAKVAFSIRDAVAYNA